MKSALVRLWRDTLSLTARLVLGSGLALLGCGVALLCAVLQGEITDHRTTLSERLHEEMQFALPALSGPAVVGDYAVIEQMLKARTQQPIIAQFAWTDNFGHPVSASARRLRPKPPAGLSSGLLYPSWKSRRTLWWVENDTGRSFCVSHPQCQSTSSGEGFCRRVVSCCSAPAYPLG